MGYSAPFPPQQFPSIGFSAPQGQFQFGGGLTNQPTPNSYGQLGNQPQALLTQSQGPTTDGLKKRSRQHDSEQSRRGRAQSVFSSSSRGRSHHSRDIQTPSASSSSRRGHETSRYRGNRTGNHQGRGRSSAAEEPQGKKPRVDDDLTQATCSCDISANWKTNLPPVAWSKQEGEQWLQKTYSGANSPVQSITDFYARYAIFFENMSESTKDAYHDRQICELRSQIVPRVRSEMTGHGLLFEDNDVPDSQHAIHWHILHVDVMCLTKDATKLMIETYASKLSQVTTKISKLQDRLREAGLEAELVNLLDTDRIFPSMEEDQSLPCLVFDNSQWQAHEEQQQQHQLPEASTLRPSEADYASDESDKGSLIGCTG
ncbi:MAG: hypothetical protein Q9160_001369 [Pyrenula sp. 1 TL-2023]